MFYTHAYNKNLFLIGLKQEGVEDMWVVTKREEDRCEIEYFKEHEKAGRKYLKELEEQKKVN